MRAARPEGARARTGLPSWENLGPKLILRVIPMCKTEGPEEGCRPGKECGILEVISLDRWTEG